MAKLEGHFSWQAQYLVNFGVSLFVAGALCGEVGVSLFVAGAVLGEILGDSRSVKCCILQQKMRRVALKVTSANGRVADVESYDGRIGFLLNNSDSEIFGRIAASPDFRFVLLMRFAW